MGVLSAGGCYGNYIATTLATAHFCSKNGQNRVDVWAIVLKLGLQKGVLSVGGCYGN